MCSFSASPVPTPQKNLPSNNSDVVVAAGLGTYIACVASGLTSFGKSTAAVNALVLPDPR